MVRGQSLAVKASRLAPPGRRTGLLGVVARSRSFWAEGGGLVWSGLVAQPCGDDGWMGGGGEGQIHPEMKLIGFTFLSFRDNILLIRDEPADCGS